MLKALNGLPGGLGSTTEAAFAAIAVPVHSGERLLAALNMVFPKASVSPKDLQGRFVPALKRVAQEIGKASRVWVDA